MEKQQTFVMSLTLLVSLSLILASANAALIHGKVFSWETLEPVNGVVVEINTTPVQKKVTENGSYAFEVPPGNYKLKAYFATKKSELYAEENVTIVEEGKYVIDLVLFPKLEYPKVEDINDIEFSVDGDNSSNYTYFLYLIPLIGVIVVLAVFIFKSKSKSKDKKPDAVEFKEFKEDEIMGLPEDLKEILEILVREGGRISQRDLRKKLGYSEAKVSLMIADLERRGIVEKVKKGRGNIIFLADKYIK
ncbi:hypothetical protein DRP07_08930 [Archaeoglobales archaeon]|nr:MAG: hypothetical protein DRP07_08930 [Archaeoglobales archaeon]